MNKIIISVMLALGLTSAYAQIGTDFCANLFMSIGGGVNYYQNEGKVVAPGFSGGIAVGKWILSPLASRVGLDYQSVPIKNSAEKNYKFASASMEFLWDFNSTFTRIKHWRVNFYPMIGLGVFFRSAYNDGVRLYDRAFEMQGLLGFNMPIRIGGGWDVFGEYKCYFLPIYYDGGGTIALMHTLTVGVTYNFTESPFYRRTKYESRGIDEDWFVGAGIGANYSAFNLFTNSHFSSSMIGVAPEVMFGRNFSNFWTIRFDATGLTGHELSDMALYEEGDAFTFTMVHADVMINLSHAIDFKRGANWNIMPYLGAGTIWRYDKVKFDMAADFGLFFRRYISREGDLFVDLKYIVAASRIGGSKVPPSSIDDFGLPSITVGYIYNFGRSSTRYRIPYGCAD